MTLKFPSVSHPRKIFRLAIPLAFLASSAWLAFGDKTDKAPEKEFFDPVEKKIEGWTVHVDPSLLEGGEHAEEGKQALKMLANHLQRIEILLPEKPLAQMKEMEIWLEHHHPELSAMQYHPGVDWLKNNGHDPRLAKKVHITRAAALSDRGQMLKHPAVILHELAHAYHDQVLGFGEPSIIAAYDAAMTQGILDKVKLFTGREGQHYGATNHKEYFAEATEAYLYRNDFYPFVAAELRDYDPKGFDVMKTIWGPAAVR